MTDENTYKKPTDSLVGKMCTASFAGLALGGVFGGPAIALYGMVIGLVVGLVWEVIGRV